MLGIPIRRLEVCDSTNTEAAAWARDRDDPAPHGALVVADGQRAGRGRLGRRWETLGGAHLYMSLVLRPPLEPQRVPPLSLCAGLAVHRAVAARGAEARVKWPNDVLVGDRKLAGILVEMSQRGGAVDFVIVGVGINVRAEGPMPEELGAIDLAEATGSAHSVASVREDVCAAFEEIFARYLSAGVPALEADFGQVAVKRISFARGEATEEGEVVGLGEDGSLRVVDTRGREHRIIAGEITAL